MSLSIIEANPTEKLVVLTLNYLNVSEFFCDTIQGENFVGWPAAFLRLQHCTLSCNWCDTSEVWHYGNPYTFNQLFDLMEEADLIRKFKEGQILVVTGGSPLRQQTKLIKFFVAFLKKYDFFPYTEIENECTIMPDSDLYLYINRWNNSPKLRNSGNADWKRYQPEILKQMSSLDNSWFKFVILGEYDWQEIKHDFLDPGYIRKDQIVLMPEGATRVELEMHRKKVVEIAIRENVRYCSREHVVLWDRKTGV